MYYVEGSNEAIVSQTMFEQAAQLRSERMKGKTEKRAEPNQLAKKVTCGCCGGLLRLKQTNNIWYWVCRKHEESVELCPQLCTFIPPYR